MLPTEPQPGLSAYVPPSASAPYANAIREAERAYSLPHNLLMRLIHAESNFNPAVSSDSSVGIVQINVNVWTGPRAEAVGAALTFDPVHEPFKAIDWAGGFLRNNMTNQGRWDKALAAYNWGSGNLGKAIRAHGDPGWHAHAPPETQNYIRKILEGWARNGSPN